MSSKEQKIEWVKASKKYRSSHPYASKSDEQKEKNRQAQKRYQLRHPERIKEQSKKRYWVNREKINIKRKQYYQDNLEDQRKIYRDRARSKLPIPTRLEPASCEVCNILITKETGRLHLDHCHVTNTFRGWLCGRCNKASGLLKDDIKIILSLVDYLRKHQSDF